MRLDLFLLKKNLLENRTRAVYFIKSGKIKVNDLIEKKPSFKVSEKDQIELIPPTIYVSKGGYKLESFMKETGINVKGKTILDIGCSTGGFAHYFITDGAKKVIAVDIADNILSPKLSKNKNLDHYSLFDATKKENIKKILKKEKMDIISIDISDQSIRNILTILPQFLKRKGKIIALFKPHYEGKKGIVPQKDKEKLAKEFEKWLTKNTPLKIITKRESSERGGFNLKGNKEIFYWIEFK